MPKAESQEQEVVQLLLTGFLCVQPPVLALVLNMLQGEKVEGLEGSFISYNKAQQNFQFWAKLQLKLELKNFHCRWDTLRLLLP